jgi:hypothetical protein
LEKRPYVFREKGMKRGRENVKEKGNERKGKEEV